MGFAESGRRRNGGLGVLVACMVIATLARSTSLVAQDGDAFIGRVRSLEIEGAGLRNPAGLAFSPRAGSFHVLTARAPGRAVPADTDLVRLTPFGERAGSARIAASVRDPLNVAFDPWRNRLLILQSPANHLVEVLESAAGDLDPGTLVRHDVRSWGLQAPRGLAVDPASGHLFILDAAGPRIVRVEPAPDGSFDEAVIATIDLQPTGLSAVRGLALDPTTGHLHTVNLEDQSLYEVTPAGDVVAVRDLGAFAIRDLQGMTFAPSGDLTDDPAAVSLFIADSGLASASSDGAGAPEPEADRALAAEGASGEIVEFTFSEAVAPAATVKATLVRAIHTSQWSPPSPDPCGITYLPTTNTLLISDPEVNEMPIFAGSNLYRATLAGELVATASTMSFSDEPTGIDLNPTNGHLIISDDTGTRMIYEWSPGPDGLFDTADDVVTSFRTADFGSWDPEDVAYATEGSGVLYIVDGANREVYRVAPGANGIFDGVPPYGDDQVTQFDTLGAGLDHLQGIVFVPGTGHLYIVGMPGDILFEFTTDGDLVRTIDISAASPRRPSGLALAPSSQDPTKTNLYIVARGVDNDTDPGENDGMLYEVTFDAVAPPIPTVTPTPTTGDLSGDGTCLLPLVVRNGAGEGTAVRLHR